MKKDKLPSLSQVRAMMRRVAKQYGISRQASNTWRHSTVIWGFASRIAREAEHNGYRVNKKLLKVGCYVHDMGRMVTGSKGSKELQDGIYHFYEGYRIMKQWGYPSLARVCLSHACGGGLSKQTNKRYGFAARNFFPESIEEKIIAYADARTGYKKGTGPMIGPFAKAYQRFKRYDNSGPRLLKNHRFIEKITNKTIS